MSLYNIIKIKEHIYCINDKGLCSVYVIVGTNKALVIDTGIKNDEAILPQIKKITNKPLIVALTHGHYDHTGHINEFDSFYMDVDDITSIESRQPHNIPYIKNLIPLKNNSFDLGKITINAYKMSGHTKGSVIFVDSSDKILFTGDQFGSGCGVWMQVLEATNLSTYIDEINKFKVYLAKNYKNILFNEWQFLGGHLGQEKTSRLGVYNPLNSELVDNLIELSKGLINNTISLQQTGAKSFNNETSYYASYKNAEMIIRKSLIN